VPDELIEQICSKFQFSALWSLTEIGSLATGLCSSREGHSSRRYLHPCSAKGDRSPTWHDWCAFASGDARQRAAMVISKRRCRDFSEPLKLINMISQTQKVWGTCRKADLLTGRESSFQVFLVVHVIMGFKESAPITAQIPPSCPLVIRS